MPRLASRDRLSFSRLPQVLELPDLIAVQRQSFNWFIEEGIAEVLADISPIEDFTGTLKLELADHVFDPPKHSEEECRDKDMTYARPLFVTARFMNSTTGEIKEQTVFLGRLPDDDRPGHVHHQRHRAHRRLPARPLPRRLLRDQPRTRPSRRRTSSTPR